MTPIQQKIATHAADASSVGAVGVTWMGVLPTIASIAASVTAVAWIAQRWYWEAKDRKAKREEKDGS